MPFLASTSSTRYSIHSSPHLTHDLTPYTDDAMTPTSWNQRGGFFLYFPLPALHLTAQPLSPRSHTGSRRHAVASSSGGTSALTHAYVVGLTLIRRTPPVYGSTSLSYQHRISSSPPPRGCRTILIDH